MRLTRYSILYISKAFILYPSHMECIITFYLTHPTIQTGLIQQIISLKGIYSNLREIFLISLNSQKKNHFSVDGLFSNHVRLNTHNKALKSVCNLPYKLISVIYSL